MTKLLPLIWRLALVWPLVHVALHLLGFPHSEGLSVIP